ncbi:MAG TPA: WecB/TagA/CpsF family glycosyltransferase [Thermoleophilaceae bacterium]
MSQVVEGGATPAATVEATTPGDDFESLLRGDRRIAPRGSDRRRRPRKRVDLMGLPVDQMTEAGTIDTVLDAVRAGRGGCLFTPNLHHMQAFASGDDGAVYDRSSVLPGARLVVADGMPLIWASRLRGTPLPERVAGSNLIMSLTSAAARDGASIFLLGGNPGAARACAERMRAEHPDLRIAGLMSPPQGFEKDKRALDEIVATLRAAAPEIVYLALGFPKQEALALQLSAQMPTTWFVGVGISFSFVCGEVRRAPRWMQAAGLEWIHRLVQEPRRLFRRYVVDGVPFAARMFAHALRSRQGGHD